MCAAAAAAPPAPARAVKPSVAVFRLEPKHGVPPGAADLLTDTLLNEVRGSGAFSRVVSPTEIEALITLEQTRQLMNCSAVGAYTGVAGHLVWPGSGVWADTSQGVLALLAAGAAMLFVRDLSGIAARLRLLDRAVLWAGFAGLVLAAVYMVVERSTGVMLIGGYLLLACFTSFLIAYLAWRRGDVVGLWVLLAYTPLGVAVTLVLARIFGLARSFD